MAAITLPTEIWLMVFSHLGYFELKKCLRVNTYFPALVEDGAFDEALFRVPSRDPDTPQICEEFTLHPALSLVITGNITGNSSSTDLVYPELKAPDSFSNVNDELATVPPVCESDLFLPFQEFANMSLKNNRGVTVSDVLLQVNRSAENSYYFAPVQYVLELRRLSCLHTGETRPQDLAVSLHYGRLM